MSENTIEQEIGKKVRALVVKAIGTLSDELIELYDNNDDFENVDHEIYFEKVVKIELAKAVSDLITSRQNKPWLGKY